MDQFYNTLRKQLIRHEGFVLTAYKCPAGKTTIGVGRNLDDRGISRDEAMMLLDNDIKSCIAQLERYLPDIYSNMSDKRKQVLVNMTFNIGIGGLQKFRKMLAALAAGDYAQAADEMLDSRWARQVGKRSTELADMMREG